MNSPHSKLATPSHPQPNFDGYSRLRASLKGAIRQITHLCGYLGLDIEQAPFALASPSRFPLLLTREFAERIQPGNWHDPILSQVLPRAIEYPDPSEAKLIDASAYDAVGDLPAIVTPGLIHKYRGRALLIVHGACAVHCRYCFRRHFPYAEQSTHSPQNWVKIVDALRKTPEIVEIIFSGGDPLMSPDTVLRRQIQALEQIPHLNTVRIHTRIPILCPGRVGDRLLELLENTRLQTVVVVHINHAQEIDESVVHALTRLSRVSTLLNQAVLLKGVNDQVEVLTDLMRAGFRARALPYYLHLLDEVEGARHFKVSLTRAQELHKAIQRVLPGYLVPRLVSDRPNEAHKIWMNAV